MLINKNRVLWVALMWTAAIVLVPGLRAANQLICTVTDETGQPVAKGTEVALKAESGKDAGKDWMKKTNDKGIVEFKGLQDGSYVLQAGMAGYLLTNSGPFDLAGNAQQSCSPSFVSVEKLNRLLTESNEATKMGKADEALAKGKEAVAMAPTIPNSHFVLAVAYAKKGMVDEAMASAKKAAELDEKFAPMQVQIHMEALGTQAGAALAKQDFDAAIKIYQQVQALAPNEGIVYYNLALAYGHKGQLDEALKNIDKAIQLDPNDQEFRQRKETLQDLYLKSTELKLD